MEEKPGCSLRYDTNTLNRHEINGKQYKSEESQTHRFMQSRAAAVMTVHVQLTLQSLNTCHEPEPEHRNDTSLS